MALKRAASKTSRLMGLFAAATLIVTGCTDSKSKQDCGKEHQDEDCRERSGGGGGSGYIGGGSGKSKKDPQVSPDSRSRGGIGGRSGSSGG